MKRLFFIFSFLFLTTRNVQALKLVLFSNHDNVGEHDQVLGIAHVLEAIVPNKVTTKDLNIKTTSSKEIKALVNKDFLQEKVIIVAAGEDGIKGIKDIPSNRNLIICLTSHMFLKDFEDQNLLNKVNFIALPSHIAAELKGKLGSKLIETTGVPHNNQPMFVANVYSEWKKEALPQNCPKYLGIMLGGDAPTATKEIKLFTEEDAKKLASFTADNAEGACVLVVNGPRTGKHDTALQEIKTVHREGFSDHITEFFQNELLAQGVKNVTVFDFQHDSSLPYNAFDLVLGAIQATDGQMIVPGDSTSMISEALDTLSCKNVLVYESSAMNEVHNAHVASELAAGRISVLKSDGDITSPDLNSIELKSSAAEVIARKLSESMNTLNQRTF